MKSDSVKKNLVFQFVYQTVMLVIPLIISPYLTRRLGETALGIYSYTYSNAYYFVMLSMLGISKYGQRIISTKRNNQVELRTTFWSLFSLHVGISLFFSAIYLMFCLYVFKETKSICFAQFFYVLSALFDIVWFFYGIEQFKIVVLRNTIVKLLELVLIFSLVKTKNDLLIYTLIMSGSVLLAQICVLPNVMKLAPPIRFNSINLKAHVKPMLTLSIAVIAIGLYTVFDKTLLGLLASKEDVAFYEYSNRIINLPKMFIGVIGTVLFPRACNCIANNNMDEARKYYRYSLFGVYFIGIASIFGLLGVADLFAVLYYGEAFAICGSVMKSMAFLVLIIGMGEIIRLQFLIPLKKDLAYTFSIILNAVINIILSIILIPVVGIYGAIIGTLNAEIFGLLFQGFLVRKYIDIKLVIKSGMPFLCSGFIMLVVIELIKKMFNESMLHLGIQISMGALVYIGCIALWFLLLDKNNMEYRKIVQNIVKNK